MAKKRGRHQKRGGRTTPKATRPASLERPLPPDSRGEPTLYELVDLTLGEPDPIALLTLVSTLLWGASPQNPRRAGHVPLMAQLIDRWGAENDPATTALLHVVAAVGGDESTRRRAALLAAQRTHALPGWVEGLARIEVTAAKSVTHLLGDGEMLFLELQIPESPRLTLCVFVDHNLGSIVKHGFVLPDAAASAVRFVTGTANPVETLIADAALADARARIASALADPLSFHLLPHDDGDGMSWPHTHPIVQWVIGVLPEGGESYDRTDWSEEDRERLVGEFFASPWGRAISDRDRRRLLLSLVEQAADDDDPMRWSPTRVDLLGVDDLEDLVYSIDDLDTRAPDLLRAFIGFCHEQRSVPQELTDATMARVRQWAEQLRALVDDALGDEEDPPYYWGAQSLGALGHAVGSMERLRYFVPSALPDEPFAWEQVPGELVARLEPLVAIVDATCDRFFDAELRTAARRLLLRLALADPTLFTRRSRLETTAAAIVWLVATANDAFGTHGVLVRDLSAHLGVTGTPSQRAETFLRAVPGGRRIYRGLALGSPDLLTSSGGAAIVAQRDRSLELLARELVGIEAWHHGAPPVEIGDPEPLWQIARQAYHEW